MFGNNRIWAIIAQCAQTGENHKKNKKIGRQQYFDKWKFVYQVIMIHRRTGKIRCYPQNLIKKIRWLKEKNWVYSTRKSLDSPAVYRYARRIVGVGSATWTVNMFFHEPIKVYYNCWWAESSESVHSHRDHFIVDLNLLVIVHRFFNDA